MTHDASRGIGILLPVRRRAISCIPFEVDVMRPIVSGVLQENDQARYGKDLVTSGVSSEEIDILGCVVVS